MEGKDKSRDRKGKARERIKVCLCDLKWCFLDIYNLLKITIIEFLEKRFCFYTVKCY